MAKWDLSKLEKNYTPKDISDFMWAVSGLTEVIGESFSTSSDNGRILNWDDGKDDFFLMLVLDDKGEVHALIGDHVSSAKTYAAIGYCRYHRIHLELRWEEEIENMLLEEENE